MKGLILGKSTILSKEVRYKENKNIIFFAPTKTGYEEKIVYPNIVKNNVNMIIFDNKHYIANDTLDFRLNKGFIPHLITISEETNINNIREFYKDKFTIYINCERIKKELDEIKHKKLVDKLIEIMDFIFRKIKEKNVECITFAIDYSYLLSLLIPLEKDFTNYLCSNNKFVFQLYHSRMEIPFLNKQLKNKINLDDYTVFKTVKDETTRELEKSLTYRNKEVLFYSVKIDKENDRIVVI